MKISVVTVAFNAESTIERTLASVATQTCMDVEHVVVDGASTDGTLGIIERHRSKFGKVISEPDHGIYDAMNKGIALAGGDVIGFLNADDVYASTGVLSSVIATMSREGLDALFGDVVFCRPGHGGHIVRRYRSHGFHPERIAWGWMPAHPALFLHRSVFERFGLFRTDYRIAGDFEFIARVFKNRTLKYRYLPEVLVRMQTGGVSTKGWRNTLLLNREVLRACHENGIRTNPLMVFSKYPAKLLEFLCK